MPMELQEKMSRYSPSADEAAVAFPPS